MMSEAAAKKKPASVRNSYDRMEWAGAFGETQLLGRGSDYALGGCLIVSCLESDETHEAPVSRERGRGRNGKMDTLPRKVNGSARHSVASREEQTAKALVQRKK